MLGRRPVKTPFKKNQSIFEFTDNIFQIFAFYK